MNEFIGYMIYEIHEPVKHYIGYNLLNTKTNAVGTDNGFLLINVTYLLLAMCP